MRAEFKIGDVVQFYPRRGDFDFTVHAVTMVLPNGIPSCQEPMLLLEGRSGVVLASHCRHAAPASAAERVGGKDE